MASSESASTVAGGGPASAPGDRVVPRLEIDAARLPGQFDREPFGYRHNLQSLDIFTPESLAELVARFRSHPKDYFVAAGARNAGTEFFSVEHGQFDPQEALRRLDSTGQAGRAS